MGWNSVCYQPMSLPSLLSKNTFKDNTCIAQAMKNIPEHGIGSMESIRISSCIFMNCYEILILNDINVFEPLKIVDKFITYIFG